MFYSTVCCFCDVFFVMVAWWLHPYVLRTSLKAMSGLCRICPFAEPLNGRFFMPVLYRLELSDIVQFNSSTAVRSVRPVSGGFRSVPFPVGLRPSSDHEPLSAPTPFITITTASTDGPPMKSFTIAPTFLGQALGIKLGFVFAVAKCFKERCSVLPKH